MQKYWHFISLVLFILLLGSFFLWPAITNVVAMVALVFGVVMSFVFILQRNLKPPRRRLVIPRIALEMLAVVLMILIASLLGRSASAWVGLSSSMLAVFAVLWGIGRAWKGLMRRNP